MLCKLGLREASADCVRLSAIALRTSIVDASADHVDRLGILAESRFKDLAFGVAIRACKRRANSAAPVGDGNDERIVQRTTVQ